VKLSGGSQGSGGTGDGDDGGEAGRALEEDFAEHLPELVHHLQSSVSVWVGPPMLAFTNCAFGTEQRRCPLLTLQPS
jgi:hypothetical protein